MRPGVEPLHPAARHARGGQLKTIMSQLFHIHPENPQARLIREAVKIIQQGGVIAYPTDSCYALGCHLGDKRGGKGQELHFRFSDQFHWFNVSNHESIT